VYVETDMARAGLSSDELKELQDTFALFDVEKKGMISTLDLRKTLDSLGPSQRSSSLYRRVQEDRLLGFDEFVELVTEGIVTLSFSQVCLTCLEREE